MSANTSSLLQRSHLPFGRVFRSPSSFSSFSSSCRSAWSRPVATAIVPPLSSTSSRLPSKYRYHSSLQSTPTTKPIFAENVNPEQLSAPLQSLLDEKQWILDERRMGVAKTYYFKTYTKSLDFVQVVGIRCKSKNHHPTITLKSGSVHVHWTTHFPRGLTQKDIDMAQYCDQQAALIGTVQQADANRCKPASTS